MKAKLEGDRKKRQLVEKYIQLRQELKATLKSTTSTPEEKDKARTRLQKLPRNSSLSRVRNRCLITGRSRSVYRTFKLSRIELRRKALQSKIPGLKKASW